LRAKAAQLSRPPRQSPQQDAAIDTKAFTADIRFDTNYTYSFNHPRDGTIGGWSEIFRSGEIQVTQIGVGGEFHYENVRVSACKWSGAARQTVNRDGAKTVAPRPQ
jgi:hypothetical protein